MAGHRFVLAGGAALLLLQGCAQVPYGPTVQVLPARGKPFEAFAADDAVCRQYASSQVAGQVQRANEIGVGTAVVGTVLGAGLGAAVGGGRGAGIGAASGAMVGSAVGGSNAGGAQYGIQGQYDAAYAQCQYAKGNQVVQPTVTVYQPPAVVYQPPPVVAYPAPGYPAPIYPY